MDVLKVASTAALTGTLAILKDTSIFRRVVDEIHRNNAAMPHATNLEKRAVVLADLKIIFKDIFDDLVLPVGKHVLEQLFEMLLEMAVVEIQSAVSSES